MVSQKQFEANRRNAQLSTGPKSPEAQKGAYPAPPHKIETPQSSAERGAPFCATSLEGKAAVRLNPLRHGLRARVTLLPPENSADFHQLCNELEAEWRPQTRTEQLLLEQMAVSQWLLMRFALSEAGVFINQMSAKDQFDLLERYAAHRARLERSFSKAMHDLEHLQQRHPVPDERPAQPVQPELQPEPQPEPEPVAAAPEPHPLIPFPLPSSTPPPDRPYLMSAPAADTR